MINFDVGRSVSESSSCSQYHGNVNSRGAFGYPFDHHRLPESRNQFSNEDDVEEEDDDDDEEDEDDEEEEENEGEDEENGYISRVRPGLDPTNLLLSSDSGDRDIDASLKAFGTISMTMMTVPVAAGGGPIAGGGGHMDRGVIEMDDLSHRYTSARDPFSLHASIVESREEQGGGGQGGVQGGGQGEAQGGGQGVSLIDPFNSDPYRIGIPSSSSSSDMHNHSLVDVSLTNGLSLHHPSSTINHVNQR